MECWSVRWWRGAGVRHQEGAWLGVWRLGTIRYRDASPSNTDIAIKLRLDSCLDSTGTTGTTGTTSRQTSVLRTGTVGAQTRKTTPASSETQCVNSGIISGPPLSSPRSRQTKNFPRSSGGWPRNNRQLNASPIQERRSRPEWCMASAAHPPWRRFFRAWLP